MVSIATWFFQWIHVLAENLMILYVYCIHLIEKTLSGEKHKPLMMRPKGFLGRCTLSFAYSKYKPVLLWLMLIAASCTWQWKPTEFERYTVRKLPKFAFVPELKQFLLENYSVELSPATNHSFTVGYMTHEVRYQNRQTMQVNSFQNANQ